MGQTAADSAGVLRLLRLLPALGVAERAVLRGRLRSLPGPHVGSGSVL